MIFVVAKVIIKYKFTKTKWPATLNLLPGNIVNLDIYVFCVIRLFNFDF